MYIWLYIIIVLLFLLLMLLLLKLYFIKKSLKLISESITDILETETNALISISSQDKDILKLTKKLNVELKKLRIQKLQCINGNQELKNLMTNISHDLRTPLTAISGYIELLYKHIEQGDKKIEYLKIIDLKTKELISLTEQLFYFTKTLEREPKIRKENICINNLLEEVLVSYYSVFNKTKIKPQINICEKKIYKEIDADLIIRVFENILSNVFKYSKGLFRVELLENGKIIFTNNANSLDAIQVKKIFNRYYTVENTKKSTGLGLSIAKQLIELNNGKISARYIKNNLIIEIEL